MWTVLRYLYFSWWAVGFWVTFLGLYPFFALLMWQARWQSHYAVLSRIWAWLWFAWCALPARARWDFIPEKKTAYLFCPNHFSFLDIPLLTLTVGRYFAFVGLHDLLKVPLLGKIFKTFHIPINRQSMKDRYRTYQDCKKALGAGKDLVIFPEGGIWADASPTLMPFKEGAFKLAIELQVPVVPVTIPYNWHILSLFKISKMQWRRSVVIFHEPISTVGLTIADVGKLKEAVFQIIENELKKHKI